MNKTQLRTFQASCIEKACSIAQASDDVEKVIALALVTRMTKCKRFLPEIRTVAKKLVAEKSIFRFKALSSLADLTRNKMDIQNSMQAAHDNITRAFRNDRSENDDTDPVYYHAPALRQAAREYAKYGFTDMARQLCERNAAPCPEASYRMQETLLGVWESRQSELDLILARTLAWSNPCREYRVNGLISVTQATGDRKDAARIESLGEANTNQLERLKLKLTALLHTRTLDHFLMRLPDQVEDQDAQKLLVDVCIKHLNVKVAKEVLEEHSQEMSLDTRLDLTCSYIKHKRLKEADATAYDIYGSALGMKDFRYDQAAQKTSLAMAAAYADIRDINNAVEWITRYEKFGLRHSDAVAVYLQLAQAAKHEIQKPKIEWSPK